MTVDFGFEMIFKETEVRSTNRLINIHMPNYVRSAYDKHDRLTTDYENAVWTFPKVPGMPEKGIRGSPSFRWFSRNIGDYRYYTYTATVLPGDGLKARHYVFKNMFLGLAPILDPIAGFSYGDHILTIAETQYEYYRDPYMFCATPLVDTNAKALGFFKFLHDRDIEKELLIAKGAIPRDELIRLIKKHSRKIVINERGAGIDKGNYYDLECSVIPRVFLREEIRRRGFDLPEGFTELFVKQFGIPKPGVKGPVWGSPGYRAYLNLGKHFGFEGWKDG